MSLEGKSVKEIRGMTKAELEDEGWHKNDECTVIVFDDGTLIYPSRDSEGNGPGALFGTKPDGTRFGYA